MSEENSKLHLLERLDHIETFKFDSFIPVHQRLKDFKATNFKSGVKLKKAREKESKKKSKVRERTSDTQPTETNELSGSETNSS